MYCGNCFRDNALVAEFRRRGHEVLMIPLYLPMTLDEEDQSSGIPVFFGGINVYLEQKLPLLGKMPDWLHKQLASPGLLKWASGRLFGDSLLLKASFSINCLIRYSVWLWIRTGSYLGDPVALL